MARYPEMRVLLHKYLQKNGAIEAAKISDPDVIGHWQFIPASALPALASDMSLLFGNR